jgi:hypothetical protein
MNLLVLLLTLFIMVSIDKIDIYCIFLMEKALKVPAGAK